MCAYLHVPTCQLLTETSFLNCRTNDILPVDIVATGALNNYFDKIINLQNEIKPLIVCPKAFQTKSITGNGDYYGKIA